jgi:hypothetical protein
MVERARAVACPARETSGRAGPDGNVVGGLARRAKLAPEVPKTSREGRPAIDRPAALGPGGACGAGKAFAVGLGPKFLLADLDKHLNHLMAP